MKLASPFFLNKGSINAHVLSCGSIACLLEKSKNNKNRKSQNISKVNPK